MSDRVELDEMLANIVGEDNLYFQPPENTRLRYPCLIYSLDDRDVEYADDMGYVMNKRYSLQYITKDPDDPVSDELALLPMCRFDRRFVADKLYHDNYSIYY